MAVNERLKRHHVDGSNVIADILQRDPERMLFFRQIGQMADQYVRRNAAATSRRLPAHVDVDRRAPSAATHAQSPAMVPFPDPWMTSILSVIHLSIRLIESSASC